MSLNPETPVRIRVGAHFKPLSSLVEHQQDMLKAIGSIPIVGWAMVLSIKYIKNVRVISI